MRRVLLLVSAVLIGSLLPGAAAAAPKGGEFGDTCLGVESGAPYGSVFEISRPNAPLPTAAPTSGVLTKWIVHLPSAFPGGVPPQSVRLVRQVAPGKVRVTAKSGLETLRPGKNEFETRLPIQSGERLAFGSNEAGSIVCSTLGTENDGVNSGGLAFPIPQAKENASFTPTEMAVPVSGVIEPDSDGDGFGDLSQDGCPESEDFHGACPVLRFADVDRMTVLAPGRGGR